MLAVDRAALYAALAEVLTEPPAWMARPGREWPLFKLAARLLPRSPAVLGLSTLPAETFPARQARYQALFGNAGRPRFWLHESAYLCGRILGQETYAVARFYRLAALEVNGSELPDHAALELAFLALLAEHADGTTERHFLDEHALRWLPALGRALAGYGDPLYATIGQLLADFLDQELQLEHAETSPRQSDAQLLLLAAPDSCTLCGFCAQRCSSAALFIDETETRTSLRLAVEKCTGCGACVLACPDQLLAMAGPIDMPGTETRALRVSERVACRNCGAPTVSQAEFNYMVKKIGQPAWLDTCLDCRTADPHGGKR